MAYRLEEHILLLVDDDRHILNLLTTVFEKEGFRHILTALSGAEALAITRQKRPDLILLDVMLPDMDGFTLCGTIRAETDAPILFLTARTADLDKLQGFGLGGDDYITKPFNPLEVAARVKAQLRRAARPPLEPVRKPVYDFGSFAVDPNTGRLTVHGIRINCPVQELKLLLYFCEHPNRILSKRQIYKDVWGELYGGDSTVMVHISRLREKIEEDPANPRWIKTVRGLGYLFEAPADRERP
ncbi:MULTISPECIES: response regulator transcription factor [Paenibacillus]|uniref:Response regulator n=1 Tax=Paenibacillus macerans TaxID=44252 RepID=A0A091A425_PAEMA|nr:response regulator transcription factor [Paenibacillus macerans]KFN11026.1 response regulator [Paenibacillus macerans]MEC0152230.1 response regulator transcription factor [Paenibacillus macerans]SUA83491.1 transcriptional regulator [Paenibacillus macerans]GBK61906.1 DNA-binding response regulator [Paenibacillus macerans]GBK68213.1 DNA-binding response regulator [Paenibacillus macerans]